MRKLAAALAVLVSLAAAALPGSAHAWSISAASCQIEGGVPEAELGTANERAVACEVTKRGSEEASEQAAYEEKRRAAQLHDEEVVRTIAAKRECRQDSGAAQMLEGAAARECAADEAANTASHQAEIAAEDARLRGEYEAAEAQALAAPIKRLTVKLAGVRGNSSRDPGSTYLSVTVSAWAHVSIKLTRHGRVSYSSLDTGALSVDAYDLAHGEDCGTPETWTTACDSTAPEPIPATSEARIVVRWSCRRPGGTYRYVITAHSNLGPTIAKRGIFRPVGVARCQELVQHERAAREQNERRYKEEAAARRHAEAKQLQRWESNCRAEGGTPVAYNEGEQRACRAPAGGLLTVPE